MAYIEREKVIEIAKDEYYSDFHRSMADLTSLRELLEDTPTADVVEVVRCKDCVFSREMDKYEKKLYLENCVGCTKHSVSYHSVIMQGDDFCSYGERKDGE